MRGNCSHKHRSYARLSPIVLQRCMAGKTEIIGDYDNKNATLCETCKVMQVSYHCQ
jgi:hypothetical protein